MPTQQDFQYYCPNCHYDCQTCDNKGNCLTCNISDNRVLNAYTKRCDPVRGFYDDYKIKCTACGDRCLACLTPTFCGQCENGYYYDTSSRACVPQPLISESGITALAVTFSVVVAGALVVGGVNILTNLGIINKKIDPRKIRIFPKFRS